MQGVLMQRYRRTEVVEAMQYDGTNAEAIGEWLGQRTSAMADGGYMTIWLSRIMHVDRGEWVVKAPGGTIMRWERDFERDWEQCTV